VENALATGDILTTNAPEPVVSTTSVPVTVTIAIRGPFYLPMRGAQIRVFAAGSPPDRPASTAAADISPGSLACGGATGARTCRVDVRSPKGNNHFVVFLFFTPPAGDGFTSNQQYSESFSQDYTVVEDRPNTVVFKTAKSEVSVPITIELVVRGTNYLPLKGVVIRTSEVERERPFHTFSVATGDISSGSPPCVETPNDRTCRFTVDAPLGDAEFEVRMFDEVPELSGQVLALRDRARRYHEQIIVRSSDVVTIETKSRTLFRLYDLHPISIPLAIAFGTIAAGLIAIAFRRAGHAPLIVISSLGFAAPLLSGLAVKVWLDAHHQPTFSYTEIAGEASWVLVALLIFGAPLAFLAFLADQLVGSAPDKISRLNRQWVFGGAAAGAVVSLTLYTVGLVWEFHWTFWDVVAFPLFWPLLWLPHLPAALVGASTAWVFSLALTRVTKLRRVA
jgi:hypothetical protein